MKATNNTSIKTSRNTKMYSAKNISANQSGMTLIEIMIVLAIIAGIAAVLSGTVFDQFGRSRVQTVKLQFSEIGKGLDRFNLDCGYYPTTDQGLQALIEAPSGSPACRNWGPNPYINANLLNDPWGNEIFYERLSSTSFRLTSLGADGMEGGTGLDADIHSDDQ